MLFLGSVFSYTCMISYDEGPSKNIIKAIEEGVSLQIPLVFFLDPFSTSFNKEVVENILNTGYEVGMSLTEEVNGDTILDVLEKYEKEFINKSGYKCALLRLPAVGQISEEIVGKCEKKGYIVDVPTLDSEDDQKSDIWPFLSRAIDLECNPVSLVFRDRYEKSVSILRYVVDMFWKKGYRIVSAGEYLKRDTKLIKVDINNSTVNSIVTKYEVLRHSSPYTIRVYSTKDNEEIKEVTVKYSTYNKLFIRDLLKVNVENQQELDELYKEILDVCEVVEDSEVKACQSSGTLYNDMWYLVLILLMM